MTASSEMILNEIREIEKRLGDVELSPQDRSSSELRLRDLRRQFSAAADALREGKAVLKG